MLLLRAAADIGEWQDDHRKERRPGFPERRGQRGLRLGGDADLQRIDPDRPFDVLELARAEIDDLHVKPSAHLAIGVLGKTDRARLGDALKPRRNVDPIAHEVAVALLDDIADMDADTKDDATIFGDAGVALDHCILYFDSAAHGVDDAAEFDKRAITGMGRVVHEKELKEMLQLPARE